MHSYHEDMRNVYEKRGLSSLLQTSHPEASRDNRALRECSSFGGRRQSSGRRGRSMIAALSRTEFGRLSPFMANISASRRAIVSQAITHARSMARPPVPPAGRTRDTDRPMPTRRPDRTGYRSRMDVGRRDDEVRAVIRTGVRIRGFLLLDPARGEGRA